jgi:hypothetical protein
MRSLALAAAIIAASSISAEADWQYTRWGMTVAQTLEASNGQLRECFGQEICNGQKTKDEVARLTGDYQWGEFKFRVYMMFENRTDTLSRVLLRLDDKSDATAVVSAIQAEYGEPQIARHGFIWNLMVWREKVIDQIYILEIGDRHLSLSYMPRLFSKAL